MWRRKEEEGSDSNGQYGAGPSVEVCPALSGGVERGLPAAGVADLEAVLAVSGGCKLHNTHPSELLSIGTEQHTYI